MTLLHTGDNQGLKEYMHPSVLCAVHGVAEGRTHLSDFTFTFHYHALEKELATYNSVLAWRILWTEEPGGRLSMDCTESDMTEAT